LTGGDRRLDPLPSAQAGGCGRAVKQDCEAAADRRRDQAPPPQRRRRRAWHPPHGRRNQAARRTLCTAHTHLVLL